MIQNTAHTAGTLKGNRITKLLLIHAFITLGAITYSYGSIHIFADLVITLTLIAVWMWRDAKNSSRNVWPWIVITLIASSFGPVPYFITGKEKA